MGCSSDILGLMADMDTVPVEIIHSQHGRDNHEERVDDKGQASGEESVLPFIAFEHVSKAFDSNVVLDDVSFFVLPGETLCIIGRSGVGKSVSLQQIMGFLQPDSGRILVAGDDITNYGEEQMEAVRRKVTMVFQNGALFDSLSVFENVAFPLRERGELQEDQMEQIVHGLLGMMGVGDRADSLPSDLSTGVRRAVAIGRALAAQPQGILYDEPTTMVDPLMAHMLADLLQKVKIQLHLTSIVVTHDMAFAEKLADRVLFLHEAKVRFFGSVAELKRTSDPVLQEFLRLDERSMPDPALIGS
jgi:phospholipid/cholesterol/gamma-HCH transport system ATP-binding protein